MKAIPIKSARMQIILLLIFLISLTANFYFGKKYTDMAVQQNLAWSNMTSHFAQVGYRATITNLKNVEKWENPKETISNKIIELQSVNEQLESVKLLPYANKIVPFENTEKIRIFIGYNSRVLNNIKDELEQKGEISEENLERMIVINKAWEGFLGILSKEENKVNPFAIVFQEKAWREVWAKAILDLDKIDLIPLAES